jgi:hypothetical protein
MTQTNGAPKAPMSDEELRAASAERDQARDPERGHVIIDYLLQNSGDDFISGLEAVLLGSRETLQVTPKGEEPPFWSVKARQIDLLSMLLNRLIAELEKNELYPLWTSGGPDFDRAVVHALWRLSGASDSSGSRTQANPAEPAQATAMAKIIHRFLDLARKAQNAEGGYLATYPGALISDGHDGLKLRRAGKADWMAFVRPLLDPGTFETFDPDDMLDLAWEAYDLYQDPDIQLRFKDADSWIAYNARFGLGTLRDAVVAALERSARRAGMRAVFGNDPEDALEGILHAVETGTRAAVPADDRTWLQASLASLAPVWPLGIVGVNAERELSAHARAGLIELGEALFREPADLPALDTTATFQSTTLLEAIDVQLASFVSAEGVTDARSRSDFALAIAVFAETFNAALAQRFVAFDLPPGKSMELLRQFLKLNVTYWWSELLRRATLVALSAHLSRALQKDFGEIDPAFAATLAQYGVDAAGWETIGKPSPHGTPPQPTGDGPQAALDAWLWERVMLVAMAAEEPMHERLLRGAADFTVEGELLRFMAQFRELRAPFPPKPHGDVAAREADQAVMQALTRGDTLPALTSLLIWTVLFARLTRFGFNRAESKAPPVRKGEWPWLDAAMAGGTLGWVADLVFGETTGMRIAPLNAFATLDHPSVDSALYIWRAARGGEDARAALATWAEQEGDANALDTLQVTRQAMNAALLHQLQEMMSPGYLQRR